MKKTFLPLKVTVACALLAALSIVCGKYLAIPVGEVLRFSFENLPVMLAGILFGPVAGVLVGVVADIAGCFMVGYTINPIVTVGAASIGFFSGIAFKLLKKLKLPFRLLIAVVVAHIIGSVLIKTFGLAQYYHMPFYLLMLWRVLNYAIVSALEYTLLLLILKNRSFNKVTESFFKR